MAFMGIFLMFMMIALVSLLVILAVLLTGMVINLIITLILYSRYTKKLKAYKEDGGVNLKKPLQLFWIFAVITMLFYIPIPGSVIYMTCQAMLERHETVYEFSYLVTHNKYEDAEKMLKTGAISPDLNPETEEEAEPGEKTLLYLLAEKGFTDNYGHPVSDEDTEDELKMMQLLIDYGADVNWVYEGDGKDNNWHLYEDETSYYRVSDGCGRTPFLEAICNGNLDAAKLLAENGADVNAVDYCGFNAAHLAADNLYDDNNGPETLKFLIKEGVSLDDLTNYEQDIDFLLFRHTDRWANDKMKRIVEKNH